MSEARRDESAWLIVGFHGTTLQGAHGVVKDRRLRGNPLVYFAGVQQPKDSGAVLEFVRKSFLQHGHNEAVFFLKFEYRETSRSLGPAGLKKKRTSSSPSGRIQRRT